MLIQPLSGLPGWQRNATNLWAVSPKASNEEVIAAIHKALEVGYRSITDTATAYW